MTEVNFDNNYFVLLKLQFLNQMTFGYYLNFESFDVFYRETSSYTEEETQEENC